MLHSIQSLFFLIPFSIFSSTLLTFITLHLPLSISLFPFYLFFFFTSQSKKNILLHPSISCLFGEGHQRFKIKTNYCHYSIVVYTIYTYRSLLKRDFNFQPRVPTTSWRSICFSIHLPFMALTLIEPC
jgi:hypothetical protein